MAKLSLGEHAQNTAQAIIMLFLDSITALFVIIFIIALYSITKYLIDYFKISEGELSWITTELGPIPIILGLSAIVGVLVYLALASITILSIFKSRRLPENTNLEEVHSSGKR
jgi:hypothetical protein